MYCYAHPYGMLSPHMTCALKLRVAFARISAGCYLINNMSDAGPMYSSVHHVSIHIGRIIHTEREG